MWGVSDKYSWIPGAFSGYGAALPYDGTYAPKPAYAGLSNRLNPNA
ncbi:endo-1,4-beta-xylanase [Streptomyces sp. NPDC058086]